MVKKQNKTGEELKILFKAFRRKILLVDAVCIYQRIQSYSI